VFSVTINQVRVPPAALEICDLEDPARRAPVGKTVAVDPHRGRLVLAQAAAEPVSIEVGYAYGFPGDLGGGPRPAARERRALGALRDCDRGVRPG
jgi:hypothetical protein